MLEFKGGICLVCGIGTDKHVYLQVIIGVHTMEGQNAIGGVGCSREMTLYIRWGGLLEEGPGGKLCYQGREKIVCG